MSLKQNLKSEILNVGGTRFDAKRQIDDAISLRTDVEVVKPNSVARNDESAFQKTVDCAVSAKHNVVIRSKFN